MSTNRFHILQECDDVVSEYSCDSPNTIHAHIDITPAADPNQGYKHLKASRNDAITISNPTTALKGKQKVKSTQVEVKHQGCPYTQAYRPKTKVVTNNSADTTGAHVNLDLRHESTNGTKYDLDLHHNPKRSYKNFLPTCQTLQEWEANTKFKFGFIPLGELKLPQEVVVNQSPLDSLQLHKKIKESGASNFMQDQIMLDSQLKPDAWDKYLQGYWDKQLPLLVRFGFPLDFNREAQLVNHSDNHSSAKAYPNDINAYLQEEIAHKAILGPYTQPPLPGLHRSPFMSREKPDSPHRRVIIDLSFQHFTSVNAGISKDIYLDTPFILKLPTIYNITHQIRTLGKGCHLYKVDISRAFRHVKLDPRGYDLLGLRHVNWYVDTCLHFGYRHGSALFQRLSDAVRHIMRQKGYDIMNYIDDILEIDVPSKIEASFDALQSLLHDLGFEISKKKLVAPTTSMNCLGILVDTINFTLAIPQAKMEEILQVCEQWRHKNHCDKCQLQSLLGNLLYVTKCVRTSRFFLNRLQDFLWSMEGKGHTTLTIDAKRDINWFIKFMPIFNGVVFFDQKPVKCSIELDASLTGLGARWGSRVYTLALPLGYLDMNIAILKF